MIYSFYNLATKLVSSILLAGIVGSIAAIVAGDLYATLLHQEGFPGSDFRGGLISATLFALFCGCAYSFSIGFLKSWKVRLIFGCAGGVVFGAIHGFLWISHGFSHFLGFWSFFVPYSIVWGAFCGLLYAATSHPLFWLLRLSGSREKVTILSEKSVLISSIVAIVAAFIPVTFEFFQDRSVIGQEKYLVLQSFTDCPDNGDLTGLHGIPHMDQKEGFVLTINNSYAAVLGPFAPKTAARIRNTHIGTGLIPHGVFLLDEADILTKEVVCD